MRWFRCCLGSWLASLLLSAGAGHVRADVLPDPLRLVPRQADLILEIPKPRQLVEAFTNLDILKNLLQFDNVRELYDSTNSRRLRQLVAYYEKEFGLKWPELLDRVAGGGVVVAVKLGPNPAPALVVIQGRDKDLLKRFAQTGLDVLQQELARQEAKSVPEKNTYRNVETVRIGMEFHAALAGSALLLSNSEAALHRALDLHLDGQKKSLKKVASVAVAGKLLPPGPLARLWLNMETVHKAPQAKEIFVLPRNNAVLTVLFGSLLDLGGRSPFLCGGLYRRPDGFLATIRLPCGRDGMSPALTTHVPAAGQPGSLPLLQPKGVVLSESYWLDLSKFWENRAQLFNPKQVKTFEEFNKNTGKFLLGNRFSRLVAEAGPYQRFVVVNQAKSGYHKAPDQLIPAFAFVVSLREPAAFSKAMNSILRGAGFLAGFQYQLKLIEEKHGDYTMVGYRFPESASAGFNDVDNFRFNFSPCFVTVGDQFVVCSTLELCRELVDLLHREKQSARKASPAAVQARLYASGGAEALRTIKDRLLVQTILGQALPPDEAKAQVQAFIGWVRGLGVLRIEVDYGQKDFHYDVQWKLAKILSTKDTKK